MNRAELISVTKEILRTHAIHPKKSLGQNFCVEPDLLQLILETVKLIKPKVKSILEIGGGLGTLSELLTKLNCQITIVEKDDNLSFLLEKKFRRHDVKIINDDVLNLDDNVFKNFDLIIGNIPYEISSPLLFKIWGYGFHPNIILTVQKEFAKRLSASSGTQEYGRLSAMTQLFSEPKLLKIYPPSSFYPVPKVAHGVIWLQANEYKLNLEIYTKEFRIFMIQLFNRKNKRVINSLEPVIKKNPGKKEIIKKLRLNPLFEKRVKNITPDECLKLYKEFNMAINKNKDFV